MSNYSIESDQMNTDADRLLASYHYDLPEELIAQTPVVPRDRSRLLVVEPGDGYQHRHFDQIGDFLAAGDLLVFNNTQVIPARIYGAKTTGAPVEILLLSERQHNCWLALVKPGRKLQIGTKVIFPNRDPEGKIPQITATIIARDEMTGGRLLQFDLPNDIPLISVLADFGELPLPPYINASTSTPEQYQTVYAKVPGAVAAPTAGLHFTPELLDRLTAQGVNQTQATLHVGVGTFRPVEAEDITTHQMHHEWLEISSETIAQIEATKAAGGKVYAVGTTAVRVLETAAQRGKLEPVSGDTNIFIYPGYQWRVVDGLITNFHLPGSSLMMLVSAAIGRQRLLDLYQIAIEDRYRFYSFGDAMLIRSFELTPFPVLNPDRSEFRS
jgi:S-adenosylmethionine:tRNA ribosyltransferase-isomerase